MGLDAMIIVFWMLSYKALQFSSVQFSHSVVSDSLWPHEPQHTRLPCPSPAPGVHSNSCALSWWCHPANSSSVVPFSSCPQSLPADLYIKKLAEAVAVGEQQAKSVSCSPQGLPAVPLPSECSHVQRRSPRREWRWRRTTSTWRWPGKLAPGSSLRSRYTHYSASWWRPPARARACPWDGFSSGLMDNPLMKQMPQHSWRWMTIRGHDWRGHQQQKGGLQRGQLPLGGRGGL